MPVPGNTVVIHAIRWSQLHWDQSRQCMQHFDQGKKTKKQDINNYGNNDYGFVLRGFMPLVTLAYISNGSTLV